MGFTRNSPLKIMIALFLLFFTACTSVKPKPEDLASVKIRGIYERLVQSGLSKYPPIWCGPDTLVYRTKKFSEEGQGAFLYNLITGKRLRLGGRNYFPAACTPDGNWIIYSEKTSYMWAEHDIYEGGETKELWRYEFATKRREKFLIVNNQEFPVLVEQQGEGYRIYSWKNPHIQIEMPEPRWEVVWSLGKRTHPVRKTINLYQPYKSFSFLFSDSKNRIYIKVHGDENSRGDIKRCDINLEKNTIKCSTVLDLTRTGKPLDSECPECLAKQYQPYVKGLDIFKDKETIAYLKYTDSCVFIRRIGDKEPECLAESTYYSGGQVFISPDERWIAITPIRKIDEDEGSGLDIVDLDLYVIEIRKE